MVWYLKVWKNYFNFRGRSKSSGILMFMMFHAAFSVAAFLFAIVIGPTFDTEAYILFVVPAYWLATLFPFLAASFRRIQDTGRSGWWFFVPIAGFVYLLKDGGFMERMTGEEDPKNNVSEIDDIGLSQEELFGN